MAGNGGSVTDLEVGTTPVSSELVMAKVFCVICMDGDHARDLMHIFSTQEKAQAFADSDPRDHILYDYVIDCPERMEGRTQ